MIFIKITPLLLFFCPYSVEALSALTNLGVNFIWPDDVIVRGGGFFLDFVKTNKGIRDAGSTADFRILFEIFEILEILDFFETFKFFEIFEILTLLHFYTVTLFYFYTFTL